MILGGGVLGVDVSFGGGGMDYTGESCDNPSTPANCPTGVDVKTVKVRCYTDGQLDSIAFYDDPCLGAQCKFIVYDTSSQTTKARCNFLSTTPINKVYTVKYEMIMDYYYARTPTHLVTYSFLREKSYDLGCTNYQGCTNGETCMPGSEDNTYCACIDKDGCQPCVNQGNGQSCDCPEECASGICSGGKCQGECTDECSPSGQKICSGTTGYKICGNYDSDSCLEWSSVSSCSSGDVCVNGACQAACTDECTTIGTYCEGNKLVTCSLGADGCKDKSEQTCPEGKGCWDKACRPYKMKILFLPVNWGTGEANFNQSAQAHANFFLNHLPTECNDEVGAYRKFTNCIIQNEDSFCGSCAPLFGDAGHALDELKDCANKEHYEYNYIVGLLDHYHVCPDGSLVVGYNCNKKQVVIATKFDEMTSSHELGHIFGLNDEYNKFLADNPNPLSIEYGCDSSSNCEGSLCCCGSAAGFNSECEGKYFWEEYNVCCLGNKHAGGGRSIMSFSDPSDAYHITPRAFEQSCLNQIKGGKGLKCT